VGAFFVAVMFYCADGACAFGYSSTLYNTKTECIRSLDKELASMRAVKPDLAAHGVCLEFKQIEA